MVQKWGQCDFRNNELNVNNRYRENIKISIQRSHKMIEEKVIEEKSMVTFASRSNAVLCKWLELECNKDGFLDWFVASF